MGQSYGWSEPLLSNSHAGAPEHDIGFTFVDVATQILIRIMYTVRYSHKLSDRAPRYQYFELLSQVELL